MDAAHEVNFDGLIGPTHHYGGLSIGNLASQRHRHQVSSPKRAALQGLEKMWLVSQMGIKQAVLPPHRRPDIGFLHEHGVRGSQADVIRAAASQRADLLSIAYSASAMWTANAATVSPSPDTADGRVHLTPANLRGMIHRRLEVEQTTAVLKRIFADAAHFAVHEPLPDEDQYGDEGAANHTRLCVEHGGPGIELFVYGRDSSSTTETRTFRARQSRAASELIAGRHGLGQDRCVFAQQHPDAVDAGVFHNDVIAVGNQHVLLLHERALLDQPRVLDELQCKFPGQLTTFVVPECEVSLEEAVQTYFFNSQLVTTGRHQMTLLCPSECERSASVSGLIQRLMDEVHCIVGCRFVDVRESMQNGGGPACLRLRVVLTDDEYARLPPEILLDADLYEKLKTWIDVHYRDTLSIATLGDPDFVTEVGLAMDALCGIFEDKLPI